MLGSGTAAFSADGRGLRYEAKSEVFFFVTIAGGGHDLGIMWITSLVNSKKIQFSRLFRQYQDRDQDFYLKTKTKTLGLKTKTKTLFFVLEAPRDQDCGLEDYITASSCLLPKLI